MSSIGASNLSNLIEMGFDIIAATPAPDSSRRLSKECFYKFGNVSKASEKSIV